MLVLNEYTLVGFAVLLLLSIFASKISDRFGVPALLLFLVLGMLAGSDGIGGIYFDDAALAQFVGVVALTLILFSGGLDTQWDNVRPVFKYGLVLSTVGVLLTALILGLFAQLVLGFSWLEGLLLGAIVSSTDAAAVFAILRSKGISLKEPLKPLLELESGSNDPMAIFLTVGLVQLLSQPTLSVANLIPLFFTQMAVGAIAGYGFGRAIVLVTNQLKLGFEGLYPVLTLAMVFFAYGTTALLGGSGFLAVYVAGIVASNQDFVHRRSLARFHDALAWLMQIAMFLTLGLLVFPSRLVPVMGVGFLLAAVLILIARPVSVFLSLLPSRHLHLRAKALLSWVGLRGAAPIVLATFPLLARLPQADLIFNIVFFIVLTSTLLQGTTIPLVARCLGVDAPDQSRAVSPLEYVPGTGFKSELKELVIPHGSPVAGKAIVELGLPAEFLIVLIARNNTYQLPNGGTCLAPGDILLVLSERDAFQHVQSQVQATG